MSDENIESINKSSSNFEPPFVDHNLLPDIAFNGHCLIENNISISKKVINLDVSYKLTSWLRTLNIKRTLNNCFGRSVKLIENADPDKYKLRHKI